MKKTETKSTVLLEHHLKALKLPTVLAECGKVAARAAADNVDHLGFLLQLCGPELPDRERPAAGVADPHGGRGPPPARSGIRVPFTAASLKPLDDGRTLRLSRVIRGRKAAASLKL